MLAIKTDNFSTTWIWNGDFLVYSACVEKEGEIFKSFQFQA